MPGCSDNCYLYWEDHSFEHLPDEMQTVAEKELKKYKKGEECNMAVLKGVVTKKCLGGYLKDPDNLRTVCRAYWELPEPLSAETRMAILGGKKNGKWKMVTLFVAIAGIICSSGFAYLNYTKPSTQSLENEIGSLKTEIEQYEQEIDDKNEIIKNLSLQLPMKSREVENE